MGGWHEKEIKKKKKKKRKSQFTSGLGKCLIPSSEEKKKKKKPAQKCFFPQQVRTSQPGASSLRLTPSLPPLGRNIPACSQVQLGTGAGQSQPPALSVPSGLRERRDRELCVSGAGGHAPAPLRGSSGSIARDGAPALEKALPSAPGRFHILPAALHSLPRYAGGAHQPEDHSQVRGGRQDL